MPKLSARGSQLADHSPFSEYMLVSRDNAHRRWRPDRPDGFIDLSVAENRLVWDLLEPQLSAVRSLPPEAAGYDDIRGNEGFRTAVAGLAGRTFFGREVGPDSVFTLAGAGAVLEAVFYALCDPGEGVLVATPGYAGFWMDLEQRDEVVIVPVPTRWEDRFRISLEALDRAYEKADRPIRALLLASPDNPTGRVLAADEISDLLTWCRSKGIHAVFDEVYALSVHDGTPFVSVASLTELGDDVHVIWALSKDFAVSGFRCGVVITENERLGRAVSAQGIWSGVSGRTQRLFAEMLSDAAWTDHYLTEMRRRLARAHTVAVDGLTRAAIGHIPGQAGFFLMADFRPHLGEPTFEGERALWMAVVEAGVNMTPGAACRSEEPGLFRICFAAAPPEAITTGFDRIAAALD